jgi:5-methylcytosine-specific restriction endonuclease McrA
MHKGAAKAVCPETYQTYDFDAWLSIPPDGNGAVRSKNFVISAPHVIVLSSYDKVPTVSSFSKRNVFKRDKYICQYCGKQTYSMTIDHVTPKSRGGQSIWTNVVTACEPCNKRKADRTPDEAGMHLIARPYRPNLNISVLLRKQTTVNPIWMRFI